MTTDLLPDLLDQVARTFVLKDGTVVQGRRGINFITDTNMTATIADNALAERVDVTVGVDETALGTALAGDGLTSSAGVLSVDFAITNLTPTESQTLPAGYSAIAIGGPYVVGSGILLTLGSGSCFELETPSNRAGLAYTEGLGRTETIPADSYTLLGGGVPYVVGSGMVLNLGRNAVFQVGDYTGPIGPQPVRDVVGYGAPSGTPSPGDRYYDRTNDLEYRGNSAGLWLASGQPARAWTIISDTTLATDGLFGSITIPQTFTHVRITIVGRGNSAAASGDVLMRINGDSGANYDSEYVRGVGAVASSAAVAAGTSAAVGAIAGTTAAASKAGTVIVEFPDYRSTTFQKIGIARSALIDPGVVPFVGNHAWQWRSTAAITAVVLDFVAIGTGWLAGSRLTLEGIR